MQSFYASFRRVSLRKAPVRLQWSYVFLALTCRGVDLFLAQKDAV